MWNETVGDATLATSTLAAVAADPALSESLRRGNNDNLLAWATANLRAPGEPVPANICDLQMEVARDMVRRGQGDATLEAYRTGQNTAWQLWMQLCFDLTNDPAELQELLTVTSASISTFIDATISAIARQIAIERDELTRGSQAERREIVTLILGGSPVAKSHAERVLAYRLDGPHTAAVLWGTAADGDGGLDPLERFAEALVKTAGARHRLTVVASANALWIWIPATTALNTEQTAKLNHDNPHVGACLGLPGKGLDGFRRSHLSALETQRFVTTIPDPPSIASFAQLEVASLFGSDPTSASEFVQRVLGNLADAPKDVRETVRVYIQALGNASETAARLFAHRNTVVRRLERADALLPHPLHEDPLRIGLALELDRWRSQDFRSRRGAGIEAT
ncbi:DNA-binding transcriptional regulator, PucR family [Williamsia sterculiae]|uniref:DNA-binding transcriptional regulator, PucR family n=1 Tax=Williamsia sterculiae TaxID=1344003 RepID=A0A1N7HEX4_9NOCA|nr:DNA-binding transcriptional regulator, PucR family [Williamsia sterculiae]